MKCAAFVRVSHPCRFMSSSASGAHKKLLLAEIERTRQSKDIRETLFAFQSAKKEGLKPDRSIFASLLDSFSYARADVPFSLEYLEKEMQEAQVECDISLFNSLLYFSACDANTTHVDSILDKMRHVKVEMNLDSYMALMSATIRRQERDQLMPLFDEMIRKGIQPDKRMMKFLVSECAKNKNLPRAFELFEYMKKKGIEVNQAMYTCLIISCGPSQIDNCKTLWNEMIEAEVEPDIIAYTAMIEVYLRVKRYDTAKEKYEEMKNANILPDSVLLCKCIDHILKKKNKKFTLLRYFYEESKLYGISLNQKTIRGLRANFPQLLVK